MKVGYHQIRVQFQGLGKGLHSANILTPQGLQGAFFQNGHPSETIPSCFSSSNDRVAGSAVAPFRSFLQGRFAMLSPGPQPTPQGDAKRPRSPRHQKNLPGHGFASSFPLPSLAFASASSTIRHGARVSKDSTPPRIPRYINHGTPTTPTMK